MFLMLIKNIRESERSCWRQSEDVEATLAEVSCFQWFWEAWDVVVDNKVRVKVKSRLSSPPTLTASLDFILHGLFWVERHHFFFFPFKWIYLLVQPSLQHLEGLSLMLWHIEGKLEARLRYTWTLEAHAFSESSFF